MSHCLNYMFSSKHLSKSASKMIIYIIKNAINLISSPKLLTIMEEKYKHKTQIGSLSPTNLHSSYLIVCVAFGFSFFRYFLALFFNFFNYFLWLRITDEGSIPEMRIWSILLIKSDLKWCIDLSRSLYLYYTHHLCLQTLLLVALEYPCPVLLVWLL